MSGDFARLAERYGQRVTVRRGEAETAARAFLRPMSERREDWRQELPTPLGVMKRGRWLYLGEAEISLEDMDEVRVLWGGRTLRVRDARPVYVGERLSHWRAVLDEKDGG